MAPVAKPVLDIDTLAPERSTVKIKTKADRRGKLYEIASVEDIGLRDQAKLGRLGREVEDLAPAAEAVLRGDSEDDDALLRFERALDSFLGIVILELPQDVITQLQIAQKEALVDAFTQASPLLAKAAKAAKAPPRPPRKARKKSSTRAR